MTTETEEIRTFYDTGVAAEWSRLERHPHELAINLHIMDRYIRPGDRVLDAGGGPGRYSLALAERGCDVTLLDLSPNNAAFARQEAARRGLPLRALAGDVRQAAALVRGPFDRILLMGPLYHLLAESDRAAAVEACLALLKPGGTLFAAFISSLAGFLYYMRDDPAALALEESAEERRALVEDRPFAGDSFTTAYFARIRDIVPFMEACGLETLHLAGSEGMIGPYERQVLAQDKAVYERILALSMSVCERPELLPFSEHLLYVGRKPA